MFENTLRKSKVPHCTCISKQVIPIQSGIKRSFSQLIKIEPGQGSDLLKPFRAKSDDLAFSQKPNHWLFYNSNSCFQQKTVIIKKFWLNTWAFDNVKSIIKTATIRWAKPCNDATSRIKLFPRVWQLSLLSFSLDNFLSTSCN